MPEPNKKVIGTHGDDLPKFVAAMAQLAAEMREAERKKTERAAATAKPKKKKRPTQR